MSNAIQWRDLHPKVKRGVLAAKENMSVINGRAVSETGVDISHLVEVVPRLSVEQIRGLDARDELSTHQTDNGGFVFAFFRQSRMIEERFPSLLKPDMARLMFVGTYTAWGDGQLIFDNGRSIDKGGLHALVNMSRKRFNEFFNRLTDEGIVQQTDDGALYMNPSVFYRGTLKEYAYDATGVQYTRLFRQTVRDLYRTYNGRSLSQLALIYAVMPFVNFKTNIIAYNAEVLNGDNVRPMSLDKLAVLLDYGSAQKLKTALNRVRIDDKPVFGFFENPHDRRSIRIVVNPNVIFAAGATELGAIRALFS